MSRKKILICPLNWGIGHATRCVPLVKALLQQDHEVILAADKAPLAFLRSAFPQLRHLVFPGFEPRYSSSNSQVLSTLIALPAIHAWAKRDHAWIEKAIQSHQIDAVISDNRFGAWSSLVPSVFITHQLNISIPPLLKGMKPIVNRLNHTYIRRFSACWVPDYRNEPNLSGVLSHPPPKGLEVHYIGPLSRFYASPMPNMDTSETACDLLVILSGPEPQRSLLEQAIIEQAKNHPLSIIILRGRPGEADMPETPDNIRMINHAQDEQMIPLIKSAKMVLSRPGYSTIMDLMALKKNAFFIPTPGQTEQTYLAENMKEKSWFDYAPQHSFALAKILENKTDFNPPALPDAAPMLEQQLKSWLASF